MAQIDIGGDGSVMWKVSVDHVRKDGTLKHEPRGNKGHYQQGVDEVSANQHFTVSIEVPGSDIAKNELTVSLHSAANSLAALPPGSGAKVSFSLPIEANNQDQIQVQWTSEP
jgi:hypothetical protein